MDKITVILISSVRPEPTSAGQVILYRHLVNQPGIDLQIYGHEPKGISLSGVLRRMVGKLGQTPLRRFAEDFWVFYGGRWISPTLPASIAEPKRTVVVTMAHGEGFMAARCFARKHGLPLVSFFHDWWPDIAKVHPFAVKRLAREYQSLADDSSVALCASEGMRRNLGSAGCVVLPPIPSAEERKIVKPFREGASARLRVFYSGNLGEYAPMLAQALIATESHRSLQLEVRGANPVWPAEFTQRMSKAGRYLPFAPRAELDHWLESADAFLVAMLFDPAMRRRMQTSFPSKLIEFAQFGKPLVIWGPEYCAAVQWAKDKDSALCVTNSDPQVLLAALEKLASDKELRERYAAKAVDAAAKEFDPDKIQHRFRQMLEQALTHKPGDVVC